jgi:hypothetical protein
LPQARIPRFFAVLQDLPLVSSPHAPATWPAPPVSVANEVLHTSAGGSGALHVFVPTTSPFFEPGVTSDFMYRIADFTQAFQLRTARVQFTGK